MPNPKKYDVAVFIGRFQPYHLGHLYAVRKGLEIADRVLVLVGSADRPRSAKNPFTADERETMIRRSTAVDLPPEDLERVHVKHIRDYPYNDQLWIAEVLKKVDDFAYNVVGNLDARITLIGHEKDDSSFYLKFFPQWKFLDTGYEDVGDDVELRIDATHLREFIFGDKMAYAKAMMPKGAFQMLDFILKNGEYMDDVRYEFAKVEAYKRSWASAPFPPVLVTVDNVVIQSGHVLVVERGEAPGRGLYALPGGFLDVKKNETLLDGALRELEEETQIKLQTDVLKRCLRHVEVFDHPGRDLRGRCITHAHLFKLNDARELPAVKGADDAADAVWLPLSDVRSQDFFADHFDIIQTMIGKL